MSSGFSPGPQTRVFLTSTLWSSHAENLKIIISEHIVANNINIQFIYSRKCISVTAVSNVGNISLQKKYCEIQKNQRVRSGARMTS